MVGVGEVDIISTLCDIFGFFSDSVPCRLRQIKWAQPLMKGLSKWFLVAGWDSAARSHRMWPLSCMCSLTSSTADPCPFSMCHGTSQATLVPLAEGLATLSVSPFPLELHREGFPLSSPWDICWSERLPESRDGFCQWVARHKGGPLAGPRVGLNSPPLGIFRTCSVPWEGTQVSTAIQTQSTLKSSACHCVFILHTIWGESGLILLHDFEMYQKGKMD